MNFLVDALNINYSDVHAAFSFRSNPTINTDIVYSDPWASGASSGILNTVGGNGFFATSGTGTFNTSNYFRLNKNYSLNNSTILLSYEKLRTGNEVLLSSITGASFANSAGFNLGVNDANKLYLKYWNNVEGPFTFTYTGILSDKNIIVVNRTNSVITLGHLNNNTFKFSSQEFEILQNNFINTNDLFVGGTPNRPNWDTNNPSNFSGYIDRLYIFNNIPFVYADVLCRGFFSEPTGFAGDLEEYCYVTGFLSGSGFSYSTVTGILVSGFQSGITGITGYQDIVSGYSFTGITGYSGKYLGSYIDNCGNNIDITEQVALSGSIYNEIVTTVALTGITYVTGFVDVPLVGLETGIENIFVTGLICDSYFNNIGDVLYAYDNKYLESLSYKEISLLTQPDPNNVEPTGNDVIEIYAENYQPKTLEYNKNLAYDTLNENYFYIDREFKQNEVLMFGNGQALIDNGYELIPSGYEIIRSPNFDYFITGTTVETNKFFGAKDYLFYDFFSGRSSFYPRLNNTFGEVFYQSSNSGVDAFVFKNGQKLISGVDYSVDRLNSIQLITGTGERATLGRHTTLSLNSDGDLLAVADRLNSACNNVYIYKKNSNSQWTLHQTITGLAKIIYIGPTTVLTLDFEICLSPQGNVLAVLNGRDIDILTGSKNSNWNICKTFTYPPPFTNGSVFSPSDANIVMNNDGSLILVNAPGLSGMAMLGFPSPNTGILIFTGSSSAGNWEQNGFINPNLITSGATNRRLHLNKNGNILGISERINSTTGIIRVLTGYGNNWGLCPKIISGSGFSTSIASKFSISEDGSVITTSNPFSGAIQVGFGNFYSAGAVYIYTGSINSEWNLKQVLTGSALNNDTLGLGNIISSDGSTFIFSSGIRGTSRMLKYKGNKFDGWSLDNVYSPYYNSSLGTYSSSYGSNLKVNDFGDTFITSDPGADIGGVNDVGLLYLYSQGMNLYFLNEEFSDQLNYYMVREVDNYNNYSLNSGISGTLPFNKPFNHGCSQVYYNGIKQRLNSNYIENSRYDLLSGTFKEPTKIKEIIYNNTDDFFV